MRLGKHQVSAQEFDGIGLVTRGLKIGNEVKKGHSIRVRGYVGFVAIAGFIGKFKAPGSWDARMLASAFCLPLTPGSLKIGALLSNGSHRVDPLG